MPSSTYIRKKKTQLKRSENSSPFGLENAFLNIIEKSVSFGVLADPQARLRFFKNA